MTFENIGRLFAGLEPGPLLDTMDQLFAGMMKGIRANPINLPGSAYHHALQVISAQLKYASRAFIKHYLFRTVQNTVASSNYKPYILA